MYEVLEAVKTVMIQDDNTEFLDVHKVDLDLLQSLNNFFINVSYHTLVASLTLMALFYLKQSHQSKTSYKYMI